jgi:hypothetical protein
MKSNREDKGIQNQQKPRCSFVLRQETKEYDFTFFCNFYFVHPDLKSKQLTRKVCLCVLEKSRRVLLSYSIKGNARLVNEPTHLRRQPPQV